MDSLKRINVRFYRSPAGTEPVRDWLKNLLPSERLVLGTDIKTVEFGWPIGLPVCRSLGGGLWEVRSQLRNRIARVVFFVSDDTMWLLHGFIKKQQKPPPNDLKLARRRMREIQSAIREGRRGTSS